MVGTSASSGSRLSAICTSMKIFFSRSQSGLVAFHEAQELIAAADLAALHREVDLDCRPDSRSRS